MTSTLINQRLHERTVMNLLTKTDPYPRALIIGIILILIFEFYDNKTNKNEMIKLLKDSVNSSTELLELSSVMVDIISAQKEEIAKLEDMVSKLKKGIDKK